MVASIIYYKILFTSFFKNKLKYLSFFLLKKNDWYNISITSDVESCEPNWVVNNLFR